ncbi:MAG: DUF72 domain-containing protein [Lentisphaerae bacterium]|nr:DUF72 domain-containing protein [Lentisphaerota bacterium]
MITDTKAASRIAFGIAGWSYPDWDGYVYPNGVRDKLRYIAPYVDVIEINSTFYRPPSRKNAESWVERTSDLPGFSFTAKLHQDVTHRGIMDPATVDAFHRGLEPMANAGRLSHLLAQFRYDYADSPPQRAHLEDVKETFGDITNLTLELRHNSWQSPQALEFLQSLDVTVANLDYPLARNSFNLRACPVGKESYLRLHGRNAKAWFSRGAGRDETYNYLYAGTELDDIVDRAVEISSMSNSLTLVANNHFQGKEVANALQLKALATRAPVAVPPPLLEKYPALGNIAKNAD